MFESVVVPNLINPPILFFILGVIAVILRSDLEIPQPLPKLFSLYLLFAIGFHGGVELKAGGMNLHTTLMLCAAIFMAVFVPIYVFFILRLKLDLYNAAAIAATYGSVSAVTFITADAYLERLGIPYSGHMVAAMALMESPAIIVGVLLVRFFSKEKNGSAFSWAELFRESFLNGSVFLLTGSLAIGFLTAENGARALKPFTEDIYKGMLCFFLLDMGLVAAKRLGALKTVGWYVISCGIFVPFLNAGIAIFLSKVIGLNIGDAFMFTILCASASYIAVPAAMRMSVPQANPGLYVPMALAITFPVNIVIGIPIYYSVIQKLWGTA